MKDRIHAMAFTSEWQQQALAEAPSWWSINRVAGHELLAMAL